MGCQIFLIMDVKETSRLGLVAKDQKFRNIWLFILKLQGRINEGLLYEKFEIPQIKFLN